MVRSDQKDFILKKGPAEGVFMQKQKSGVRGVGWQTVADHLNSLLGFEITGRSVRYHFCMLAKKHRARMAREERATCEGSQELTEKEKLLEGLIEISEETNDRVDDESERKR